MRVFYLSLSPLQKRKSMMLLPVEHFNSPKGSIVVVDRGYNDYAWYKQLTDKGIFFVTRLKSNAKVRIIERHSITKKSGITRDHTIEFNGTQTAKKCPIQLRRIGLPRCRNR